MQKTKKISEKLQNVLLASGAVLVLLLILSVKFDFYYDLNDDVVMKNILSGAYTGAPEGHNIQMLYPLSFLLSLCYRVFPAAPCYGVFLCICQFGAIGMILYRILKGQKSLGKKVLMAVTVSVLLFTFLLYYLVFIQYTVTSSLLVAAAVIWFGTSTMGEDERDKKKFLKDNMVTLFLLLLAYCMRSEMLLFLFPLFGVLGLVKWLSEDKIFAPDGVWKYYVSLLGIFTLGLIICAGINRIAYGSADWQEFMRFFDARTEIYDFYQYPDYEGNEAFYQEVGLDDTEVNLLGNYNFNLDDEIDADTLEQIADYQLEQMGGNALFLIPFPEGLWIYRHSLINPANHPYDLFILVGYGSLLVVGLISRKVRYILQMLLIFVVRSTLWMYIILRNRTPERITIGLYLAEFLVLLMLLWSAIREVKPENYYGKGMRSLIPCIPSSAVICVAAIALFSLPGIWNNVSWQYTDREDINGNWKSMQAYCSDHEDDYYILDVMSTVAYSEKMFRDVDNTLQNYDICGGWTGKSPICYQKMEQFGMADTFGSLAGSNGENDSSKVYFIAETGMDMDWLTAFYTQKGLERDTIMVDSITNNGNTAFEVYQLEAVQR
ncbi:MAG: hypothetical protein PHP50_05135 [Lachnospiraceae bacterium]|nr:hypothetical protein [Lachnospiraceae bacterium]